MQYTSSINAISDEFRKITSKMRSNISSLDDIILGLERVKLLSDRKDVEDQLKIILSEFNKFKSGFSQHVSELKEFVLEKVYSQKGAQDETRKS